MKTKRTSTVKALRQGSWLRSGGLLLGTVLLFSGCASTAEPKLAKPQPYRYSDVAPDDAEGQPRTLDTVPSLVSDHRAYGVGQSVTVLILEEASSTTSADTSSRKSLGVDARGETTTRSEFATLDFENNSSGSGQISREGQLVASVSATVERVLASGELVIYGEQQIEFNDETQYIRVSGRIRPEDISGDNTVLSSRIAEASITYKGDGLLGSRQKPGVITRMFNWLF